MEKTELQLLNRIFQDAQIGMLAIDKILKKLENEKLKTLFKKQFESYEKFGEKYDDAIAEMMDYVDRLEQEGKING